MSWIPYVTSVFHPTDFSAASGLAFEHALAIAVQCKAELTILHAGAEGLAEDEFEHFPAVRRTLERWGLLAPFSPESAVFDRLGVRIKKVSRQQRNPIAAVHAYLAEFATDLVVLATEGREGLPAWLKPSVAERVARDTRSMTLFVQEGVEGFVEPAKGAIRLSRVLVPLAHVPDAQPAVASAERVSRLVETPVEIVLFHVGDDPMPVVGKLQDPRLRFREERGHGPVVSEIDRAVREIDADLIVMTTDGRDGVLGAMGRGSHTERVVRQAACPVLAVPVASA